MKLDCLSEIIQEFPEDMLVSSPGLLHLQQDTSSVSELLEIIGKPGNVKIEMRFWPKTNLFRLPGITSSTFKVNPE